MWEILASVALKLPDLILGLTGRTKVKIRVTHLKYQQIRNDPDSPIVIISPYSPSQYYAKLGFSHRGKPTTVRDLMLTIDRGHRLRAAGFKPLKLQHGDYHEVVVIFPIEENLAVTQGDFEIQAVDTFDNVHRCEGCFPVN